MAALARCRDGDPQRAVEAISVAERPHLHVFIATSDIHLKHKLRIDPRRGAREAVGWVRYGRERSAATPRSSSAPRTPRAPTPSYLFQVYEAVVEAGATTVNIPDTVGYAIPAEFGGARRPGRRPRRAATRRRQRPLPQRPGPGDRQHAGRGPGRRAAGRGDHQRPRRARRQRVARRGRDGARARGRRSSPALGSRVATEQHHRGQSRLVSYLTGFAVQPNKAIVGANAFAHESGIHQDGVLKNPLTYEIMTPQSVGLSGSSS